MINEAEKMSAVVLGERLRIARETARVTQAAAAIAAGFARTTLVAIEKGTRTARIGEIQTLCQCYGVSVNSMLRREAIHVDLVPRFRKLSETADAGIESAACLLNDLVSAEVELENILGVEKSKNYPPELAILKGDVRTQAEQDAQDLRHWLGLGIGPIQDLFSILELQLGIRVFSRKMDAKVSGLFAYDDAVGACILVNANHRKERRVQSGAHELGHFTATRRLPEVYQDKKYENSRDERYASAFGRAFLTPARSVMQKFKELTVGSSHLTRRHVILMAHLFGVSRQAMVMRLEELDVAKKGTWGWFEDNGGITDKQVQQVLGDSIYKDSVEFMSGHPQSTRLNLLALEAWKRGLVSEEQMAQLLKIDRVILRDMIDEASAEEDDAHDLIKLS